ncbi:Phosphoglycerate mutase [Nocardiopsis dassonvillei subsp. dassonvillei DSM 43111]|uniref:Phosphoglycerate mutase n=1 Tax=Nocardiopsis dassonvillei (strain ATCC 23218 / DSM 43111 / CIP 107115 / JCM 7437 / KCTC 9190 / NBRC 14626 / NCTC 10488 / NRRL B-5397 / IMRU 509) TaxID=446468 RepID=D7AXX2_NOCDD|nr:Phosphoglycerate mutase [Nocardiopsis dassonvillei subsp. dassonvillei DSM 43111]
MGDMVLIRHGQTEWSRTRRHTGLTDIPLTEEGERQARALRPVLAAREVGRVVTSPLRRAARTAELAGLRVDETDPDLTEWDYGGYEGITTADIQAGRPGWYLWHDGIVPGGPGHPGESVEQVGERVDRVLDRLTPLLDGGGGPTWCWWRTATSCGCSPRAGWACRPPRGRCSGWRRPR